MAEKKPSKTAEKKARTNSGHRGSRKNPQDPYSLIIQGKGLYATVRPPKCQPYAGTYTGAFGSFNMQQALINRELGLC